MIGTNPGVRNPVMAYWGIGGNKRVGRGSLHTSRRMNVPLATEEERKVNTEDFSELPGPRGIIVGSLCQSTNQRLAVSCEGFVPFPFQAEDHFIESEVRTCMQEIEFYCKKCRKTMKMNYCLCGDDDIQVLNGITIRCHTRKCTRVVTLKKITEGQIKKKADAFGKYYL